MPSHGRIDCSDCHDVKLVEFDRTRTVRGDWRITNNPLAWGSRNPEVIVLGFSKGPEQAGALTSQPHDAIAFRKGRTNLAKILHHVRLIDAPDSSLVDQAISDPNGRFHFGSLIRCTVERLDRGSKKWTGTGGGMLDRFAKMPLGTQVLTNCTRRMLGDLPSATKLILMLGLGKKQNYVEQCRSAFGNLYGGVANVNDVSYRSGQVTIVHTEHFASQGAHLPNWLAESTHPRGHLGLLARQGVEAAFRR